VVDFIAITSFRQEVHGSRRSPVIIMNNVFDNMGNLIVNRAFGSSSTIDTIFGQLFVKRRFLNVFAI